MSWRSLLSGLIALLGIAAGGVHLAVWFILFGGRPRPAPPPRPAAAPGVGAAGGPPQGGAPPRLPLGIGLEQALLLNLAAFVVLVAVFLALSRGGPAARTVADGLLGLVTVATLAGWNSFHRPNPMGLGRWALIVELTLLVALAFHVAALWQNSLSHRGEGGHHVLRGAAPSA